MFKKILLVVLVAGLGWWYFIGGRKMTEEHAYLYYQHVNHAGGMRDPEMLCELLDDKFQSEVTTTTAVGRVTESQDKKETCDGYVELFKSFEVMGKAMGGIVQLDSKYDIHSVQLSADRKTATVDLSYSLDVAGKLMRIRSRSTDTLVRRNGRVLMLRTEGSATMSTYGDR